MFACFFTLTFNFARDIISLFFEKSKFANEKRKFNMIGYLLILLFTILNLGESITVKEYAKRHGSGGMLMNAVIALFSALFFLVTDKGGFYVPGGMLPFDYCSNTSY